MRQYSNRNLFTPLIDGPGLLSKDSLAQIFQKILRYHGSRLVFFGGMVMMGNDVEALHQFRVTIRYLKSVFSTFKPFLDNEQYGKIKGYLKIIGKLTGHARDTDVFRQRYENYLGEKKIFIGDSRFYSYLSEGINKHRQLLREFLFTEEYDALNNLTNSIECCNQLDANIGEIIRNIFSTNYAYIKTFEEEIKNRDYSNIHKLRIGTKKLRYSVEVFKELIMNQGGQVLESIKILQDQLGDIHDVDTEVNFLHGYKLKENDYEPVVEGFEVYLGDEKERVLTEFIELWGYIISRDFENSILNLELF